MNNPTSRQPLPNNARKVFSGIIFDVYQWDQVQYDGSTKVFEKLKRPDTVLVLPVLPDDTLLFTEEEQPGSAKRKGFVGGRVDEGEGPLTAAKRELLEETGYVAEDWVQIEVNQPVNKVEWSVYLYVARKCRKTAEQSLDSGERIDLLQLTFQEAVDVMASDSFGDRQTDIARAAVRAQFDQGSRENLRALIYGE